jgi:hypothetical protein
VVYGCTGLPCVLSLLAGCDPSGFVCGVCLVSCGLVAAVLLFVGCRQFLGVVEAGIGFRYLKKSISKEKS